MLLEKKIQTKPSYDEFKFESVLLIKSEPKSLSMSCYDKHILMLTLKSSRTVKYRNTSVMLQNSCYPCNTNPFSANFNHHENSNLCKMNAENYIAFSPVANSINTWIKNMLILSF